MGNSEVSVGERLEEQRKEGDGGDERVFESRHSGPRDPTSRLPLHGPDRGSESNSAARGELLNSNLNLDFGSGDGGRGKEENRRGERHDVEIHGLPLNGLHSRTGTRSQGTGGQCDPDRISIMRHVSSADRDRDREENGDYATGTGTSTAGPQHRILNFVGVGAHPYPGTTASASASAHTTTHAHTHPSTLHHRLEKKATASDTMRTREINHGLDLKAEDRELDQATYPHYLTHHTTGRNAQFYGLSGEEREHLGGVEYRAITLLGWVVPLYFVLWQVLGCVGLGAYMRINKEEVIRANGIDPWWLGIFNGVSAFNNSGMSLLDANLIPFQTSIYTLVTMGMMILAGNTAYPLILRLVLSLMLKALNTIYPCPTTHSTHKATLRFILTYPRRVYTHLFPSAPTLWLLFMVVTLNGIDWIAFELLNIGNAAVEAIPHNFRVLDGLFQALAVRSGGFYIIGISELRIGLQVLYVIMMYISVYPVVITMRGSNVYEERSLGIYADEDARVWDEDEEEICGAGYGEGNGRANRSSALQILLTTLSSLTHPFQSSNSPPHHHLPTPTRTQFIRQQIRGQLSHDIWLLVLAVLLITCIEASSYENDPITFSVFNIIFEVVSGYGCVGISTGMKGEDYSFSGGWRRASKVLLCVVMVRGRHRGLPVALDRAVRLPGLGDEVEQGEGGGGFERGTIGVRLLCSGGMSVVAVEREDGSKEKSQLSA
ncbi:TrkH-domain-containing protein [Cadophora sp. DSE1049]|nr:TrkH-domain-containing protein [Cadophora sp. DSE1049]